MTEERRDEQERGEENGRRGGGGEERHARRDRVERGWFIDEAGEIPSADADVEAGISRRAERYED